MSTVSSSDSLRRSGEPTSKPRLPKESASSSTKDTARVLRLAQERARDQRAEKRAAKKEEKRLAAEKLKTEGNDLFRQKRYEEAVDAFKKACEIVGPDPIILSNAAAAYLKLDAFQLVIILATQALAQDPSLVKARYRRGMARKGMNQLKAAIFDFETVLQVDPNCHEARVELSIVRQLWESGEGEETGNGSSTDEFPDLDEDRLKYDSESDSSDYEHQGNGISCRFYNHDGCSKGVRCAFSHAPDDRSIRDELGRNVCLHFLLGSCKFGDSKCIYSHSKDFLPENGWWMTENGRKIRRDNMELEKEMRRDSRDLNYLSRGIKYNPGNISRTYDGHGGSKGKAVASKVERNRKEAAASKTKDDFILLLSLGYADTFNSIHKHFLAALRSRTNVVQAETKQSALQSLGRSDLIGVFVTDPEITEKKHAKVLSKLVEYAKAGGTVVIGGSFSTFVGPSDNDAFFKKAWGLDWKMGSYHRTTFALNPFRPKKLFEGPSLASSYSMKTVHLKGIAPETVVYGPTAESRTQSMVFPASPVDLSEAPVIYSRIGQGFLGYIGDVNGEEESTNVILSMLGLPAQSRSGDGYKGGGGRGKGKRRNDSGWDMDHESEDDERDERMMNGGYTHDELNELLCQGIKPWDEW